MYQRRWSRCRHHRAVRRLQQKAQRYGTCARPSSLARPALSSARRCTTCTSPRRSTASAPGPSSRSLTGACSSDMFSPFGATRCAALCCRGRTPSLRAAQERGHPRGQHALRALPVWPGQTIVRARAERGPHRYIYDHQPTPRELGKFKLEVFCSDNDDRPTWMYTAPSASRRAGRLRPACGALMRPTRREETRRRPASWHPQGVPHMWRPQRDARLYRGEDGSRREEILEGRVLRRGFLRDDGDECAAGLVGICEYAAACLMLMLTPVSQAVQRKVRLFTALLV